MTQNQLSDLIFAAAATHAIAAGYRLGSGADHYFHDHARKAANEIYLIRQNQRLYDKKLELAIHNFRKLIDVMIQRRTSAYANDPVRLASNEIGEQTLSQALAKLCPIWPFC